MKRIITAVLAAAVLAAAAPALAADQNSVAGTVTTASQPLNVRSGAGTGYSRITSLAKGSAVTIVGTSGAWYRIEYAAGKYGYASAEYITKTSGSYAARAAITSGSLNVRAGAGTGHAVRGSLYKDQYVVVLGQSNGWSRILHNGTNIGWASNAYLKGASAPKSAAYPAISLAVPSYKQTDSRWRAVEVGSSGRTIGDIGCTTTAVAMTESFRLGQTVTPAMMEARLSYTGGGALYWLSNYAYSSPGGYLAAIYAQLKAGRPVIVGAKKSNGSAHWVVVKGYTGGSALSASGFTVNDPGSAGRTKLSDLFAEYPIFYRIAHYK